MKNRSFVIHIGSAFAILIGLAALLSAWVGLRGKGSHADNSLAMLNLITGICSLVGGIGFLMLKKWALYVYTVSVACHFISHGILLMSRGPSTWVWFLRAVQLSAIPAASLVVLVLMVRESRKGNLT